MTPDNPEGRFSRFTNRQKVIAGAIVVVLLIVVWQVMGLFGGSSTPPAPVVKPVAQTNTQTGQQMGRTAPGAAPVASTPPGAQAGPLPPEPTQMQPMKAVIPSDQQALTTQQQDQQKQYVETINQLQMLKLQKDIDETKQSIAAARLATATAEKNITDLLTKPTVVSAPPSPSSAADYAKLMGGQQGNGPTTPPPIQNVPEVSYTVISVAMRLGRWTAILGSQGKLYNVNCGDILPPDGSTVVSISKNGVVLQKDRTRKRISVVNAI